MRRYLWTLAGLIALTLLTLGLSFVEPGPWATPVGVASAVGKSLLILIFFMHLVQHSTTTRVAVAVVVLLVVVMAGLGVDDPDSRTSTEPQEAEILDRPVPPTL